MILAVDIWLLPAIAAGSSSYLVSLIWEKLRSATAPTGYLAAFLASLSFIMGAICAYYRDSVYSRSHENNIIVMFLVGATTTYIWLLLRKYFVGFPNHRER
jgi:riboflavin transporter FmnP